MQGFRPTAFCMRAAARGCQLTPTNSNYQNLGTFNVLQCGNNVYASGCDHFFCTFDVQSVLTYTAYAVRDGSFQSKTSSADIWPFCRTVNFIASRAVRVQDQCGRSHLATDRHNACPNICPVLTDAVCTHPPCLKPHFLQQ